MQLMSISGAARHLGYKSRSQLYKLIDDGWLDEHVHGAVASHQKVLISTLLLITGRSDWQ